MKKLYTYANTFIISLGLIAAGFALVPALSYAADVSSNQVIAVSPSFISPAHPMNPACLTFTSSLYEGLDSGQVVALQNFLSGQGYFHAASTGYFGSLTLAAVKSYQGEHGIPNTGYVGPLTIASINNYSCSNTGTGGTGGGSGTVTSAPVTFLAPIGGETWTEGTQQAISWKSQQPATFAAGPIPPNQAVYNLSMTRVMPPCAPGTACPMIAFAPYAINTNLSSHGNYQINYYWNVGSTTTAIIPAGQYQLQVCVIGGSCTNSNAFTIAASTTTVQ